MGTKKLPSHDLEDLSRSRLETHLWEWVVNSLENDYAFDFEVRPKNPLTGTHEVTPSPFYVQVKSSHIFDDPDDMWHDFETEFLLDDCLEASVPVALLIYERASDEFTWCIAQRYCWDVLDEERPGWRDQQTVRIRLDRGRRLDSNGKHQLRSAVEDVGRRISTRQHVAASNRTSFSPASATELASTAQVREYECELIEEAYHFAALGDSEKALEKLLEVYQLPETSELTLDAICHLLSLREISDASVAFAKIHLAVEGLQLAEVYERDEVAERLDTELREAIEYVQTHFVGATYLNTFSNLELDVLRVSDLGAKWGEARLLADVQYAHGDLDDELAAAIASNDSYELVESGEGVDPLDDACPEREHDFDTDDLREVPYLAICADCGLSRDVVRYLLKQEVPSICDNCDSVTYDVEIRGDLVFCADCFESGARPEPYDGG